MSKISFVHPDDVTDPEMHEWLMDSITTGIPGAENQAVRAHNKTVMRSFTMLHRTMLSEGILSKDLRELMRARMSTSWGRMFNTDCHY